MIQELKTSIASKVKELYGIDIEPELTVPDERFGDHATNVALQAAKQLDKNSQEVATLLAGNLHGHSLLEKVEVAGPGFINLTLKDEVLAGSANRAADLPKPYADQEILVEFGDPNPFKELHIGHLYSAVAGDGVAGLLEAGGATARRLSYHGDVGLHVARAIWAMQKQAGNLSNDLGSYYAEGAAAYDDDEQAKQQIREINKHLYAKDDETVNKLHEFGIKHSFAYFDKIFGELGIKYEPNGRYLESTATDVGATIVKENTGKVFEESEGAIVYKGEKAGLHTRVFINSEGLPTYEAKDLGLVELKAKDYPNAARSIIITAHEQSEYFRVMLAALAEINPKLADKTTHLYHGFVSLSTGKMSSRTGEVYPASELLDKVKGEVEKQYPDSKVTNAVYIGAVKYALLKHRLGPDIVFDINESISLEGNSGPYLQYAHARARSILQKAGGEGQKNGVDKLEPAERSLARKISQYPEVVAKATEELLPSHVCTYLYELAQNFNSFYETSRIIGDNRQAVRLGLVSSYANVLKSGLGLLNIAAPDHM
ncbi:MAG TPA: arginine--tRNA ligase [Candidatus Saccharimonadales bacterium]|nr:arginine--tRNA ligase [Candidatus Saccharimonadales bacterium]